MRAEGVEQESIGHKALVSLGGEGSGLRIDRRSRRRAVLPKP